VSRTSLKRELARRMPGLSRVVRRLEALEEENRDLRGRIERPVLRSSSDDTRANSPELRDASGLPLPPAALREWVAGTSDLDWFLEGGKLGVQTIVSLLEAHGTVLGELDSVLDFGCGCGRVIRHLRHYETVNLHGTDCNQHAIVWCDEHLNFAEFGTNQLEPRTRYREHCFDLVYAFSVFTHLTESLQSRWMQELRRILKPEGLLIVTVHGDHYFPQIPASEQPRYQRGELIVTGQVAAGQNLCSAFHPEAYVRNVLAKDFDVIECRPQGAVGNPLQDVYLLRRH
jgi:SAM-dependent methyltransferase